MAIERNSSLATKVADLLRERLKSEFIDGGRLPGELELATELGVSRGTIRQGLALLEREGAIFRRQGDGTYANSQVLQIKTRAETAYEFTDLIRKSGYESKISLVKVYEENASQELAKRLEIPQGDPLIVVRKVFLANGEPAVYCTDIFPKTYLCKAVAETEYAEPIFNILTRYCNIRIDYVLAEIIPAVAIGDLIERLDCSKGSPLLQFDEVYYSEDNHPIMFSRIYFRDPLIRFTILRKKA